jgi:hypothetical protein
MQIFSGYIKKIKKTPNYLFKPFFRLFRFLAFSF